MHHLHSLRGWLFRASLFNSVPRTWSEPSGKLKPQGRPPSGGLPRARAALCLPLLLCILGSLPDHPSRAQVGKGQRLRGGESLAALRDRPPRCPGHVLRLGDVARCAQDIDSVLLLPQTNHSHSGFASQPTVMRQWDLSPRVAEASLRLC